MKLIYETLGQEYAGYLYQAYSKDIESGKDYFGGKEPSMTQIINIYDPLRIIEKRQVLRNCVYPELGKYILDLI